jgi:hypothetical protein
MAYIGKQPVVGNFVKLDAITTSATATYNLLNGGVAYFPQTANNCIVSLNGVIQSPTSAYTISGSTIVFSDALTASDSIDFILVLGDVLSIGTPSDATITNAKLALTAGSAGTPTISTAADTNTGIFFPAADTIGFAEGGTEVMRIDSSGLVGIGTTTPLRTITSGGTTGELVLLGTGADGVSDALIGRISSQTRIYGANIKTASFGSIEFRTTGGTWYTGGVIRFLTGSGDATDSAGVERMRIDPSGNLFVGKTSSSEAVAGCELFGAGLAVFVRDGDKPMVINRNTNDGTLIEFKQANAVEGTISVSGATVSYNGFTGSHWSRFIGDSKPDVLRGTVMESLDQMIDWYAVEFEVSITEKDADGNDVVKTHTEHKPYSLKANENESDIITYAWNTEKKDEEGNDIIEQVQATIVKQVDVKHMMSKISDTVEAKNVYGVFSHWDNDDLINNDFYVASVGSYVVRIKAGQTVSKGDLLQSNGDGTAKVQADDLVRASSFAKVLSNTVIDTYEDGSFIVPCSLMC